MKKYKTIDGNEAAAYVAYRVNEVIAIYPITPSSPMGEWADAWAAEGIRNIWGSVPKVIEMQSEGGAAGAIHGALQTGSLATTFTASQGLLLMIPNMYKIAGELTPAVFHVAARSLAAQGLSIFGDHSDVMAARGTGFAMLASNNVQEAMDLALISQTASLKSRIPFVHFFDGFRTSHEVAKIEILPDDVIRSMIDDKLIKEHRSRALTPDNPVLRGTAQNPDVYFQARETVNPFYLACPEIVQTAMDQFALKTGRHYQLFEYYGPKDAENLIVLMGSGCEAVHEAIDVLNEKHGHQTGMIKIRLYRPFDMKKFCETIPQSVKNIAVLDRTKEPGAGGEPLYLDCLTALHEGLENGWGKMKSMPQIVGGRYGLSSKEFTPAMVKGIVDMLRSKKLKNHFTIGILDDVTHTSLPYDGEFSAEAKETFRALFYGLGSDGTVGANKNTIKIIGENTDNYAQGYFVYDSKKAGAVTVSHLRFGPKPIRSTYLIDRADFVACHQEVFLDRYNMLKHAKEGGIFLLNSHHDPDTIWGVLPRTVQEQILHKKLKFFVIDGYRVARESGMANRINTVMQVCFFGISGVLPKEKAILAIKDAIRKTYGKKGEEIVQMNLKAVDHALAHLHEVEVPAQVTGVKDITEGFSNESPKFVREVLGTMMKGAGDLLPVSALPCDGTYPTGTTRWEKRNLAEEIPVWDTNVCIQCGKCAFVCPHSVIRIKAYDPAYLNDAPDTFKSADAKDPQWKGLKYTIQVAPEDCTGCGICVDICPAKNKTETRLKAINMKAQAPLRDSEKENWEYFLEIPEMDRRKLNSGTIRQQQVQKPLFEFSSSCAGCGETPYLKLMSQLFGDRSVIANATGCSSIYGGNLPTTPWCKNEDGRGPAWANSLFEDNAEFGLGMRVSIDKQRDYAAELLKKLAPQVGDQLAGAILTAEQKTEADIYEQRERVKQLKAALQNVDSQNEAEQLLAVADYLVKKSVWIIGGDGWAYDIGFGGLDHVIASGQNVNILVLDTEVYSNTGGQMSKATPLGAVAKFAAGGKPAPKKDLGLIAMTYGNVYVASVAMGAKDEHTLKVFLEAEAYDGPSIIIAYSHCIAHGINMTTAMQNQKAAVQSGQWRLYRFNPDLAKKGEKSFFLESRGKSIPVEEYMAMENRFKMLTKSKPEIAKKLFKEAQENVDARVKLYEILAAQNQGQPKPAPSPVA